MSHDGHASIWAPLRHRTFAALWGAWLIANLCIWMADLAAAWLMTSLTDSKFMVAMIQTATTLPVFLLVLPGGTLADRVNRRDAFLFAQLWAMTVLALTAALVWADAVSPVLLLILVFMSSAATAIRWPTMAALLPEVVPRGQMLQGISLNGVGANASRLAGPLLAGVIIAAWGGMAVFALCACLSLVAAVLMMRCGYQAPPAQAPSLPWLPSMAAGVQHVRESVRLKSITLRSVLFFSTATALMGLLPSFARDLGGGPQVYSLLFACMGAGAVCVGLVVPRVRRRLGFQGMATASMLAIGLCAFVLSLSHHAGWAAPALFLAGMGWMTAANTLSTCSQMALPDPLRARGMSLMYMAGMAGSAIGAAFYGALADAIGLRPALHVLAAHSVLAGWTLRHRLWVEDPQPPASAGPA
jgi:MFS family permease